ncbi:MAG: hypothetical protein ABL908_18535, partial [Hyphomicrobium sp.]
PARRSGEMLRTREAASSSSHVRTRQHKRRACGITRGRMSAPGDTGGDCSLLTKNNIRMTDAQLRNGWTASRAMQEDGLPQEDDI